MMKSFSSLNPMNAEFDFFFGPEFFHWPEKYLELEAGRICKVEEDAREYLFSFHIPGLDKRAVSIDVAANTLIIRGRRRHRESIKYFERFFRIPEDADIEQIEAEIDDADLMLRVLKYSAHGH